ncbi:MAG TPA: quinolinate synthase NadA [Spirochaetota bacterium]|nr:quinolinate synthase NadA [Spirochaetota bacterium]HNT10664.1 quinolinate synthase NadA [Spirochaetota bacterium]HPU90345.1 quinolinate synthase NadA [Spirochaetota bacterium]
MDNANLTQEIKRIAREKSALILAHNYQTEDVQDIADHTGDSLELARIAARNDARIIVFCGVHFMAESAHMLSPEKTVLLPDPDAGCPMADMADAEDVLRLRDEHPDAAVVTYINSSAAVKAVSDVCCTSSNAVAIVKAIANDSIIFVPDRNLGSYVQRFTEQRIIPWNGFCPTHERFTIEELERAKRRHPDAIVMVHPECRPEVVDRADEVLSTGKMVAFAQSISGRNIIVGTEVGMLHKLKTAAPANEYILAAPGFVCPNMKKITLKKIYDSLVSESPIITVDADVASRAVRCLERMLELS